MTVLSWVGIAIILMSIGLILIATFDTSLNMSVHARERFRACRPFCVTLICLGLTLLLSTDLLVWNLSNGILLGGFIGMLIGSFVHPISVELVGSESWFSVFLSGLVVFLFGGAFKGYFWITTHCSCVF